MVSRRKFLGLAGGAAAGVAAGGLAWAALLDEHLGTAGSADGSSTGSAAGSASTPGSAPVGNGPAGTAAPASPPGRVLVIVQMSGGNDGMNTLVPVGDGRYFDARPTLGVKESEALALRGTTAYALHPSLQPLVPVWARGELAMIEAIGIPGQTRSHFAASDTWWAAATGPGAKTGWLGRWLDATGDPSNPLRGIALGGGSPALVGARSVSTAIVDPSAFTLRTPKGTDPRVVRDALLATATPLAGDPLLAAAQESVPSSFQALDLLARAQGRDPANGAAAGAAQTGPGGGRRRDGNRSATGLLQAAAGIIDLQLGAQIILVAVGGFDTHAGQAATQPELLADVAGGIAGFLDSVAAKGHGDEVLVMTTSEFGRRVQENGSGTDHGTGGVSFLAGSMVRGGRIIGDAALGALDEGDIATTIDTRSLYANALDWLSGETAPADEVLGAHYDRYDLVNT